MPILCAVEACTLIVRADTPYPHAGVSTYPAIFVGSLSLQAPAPDRLPAPSFNNSVSAVPVHKTVVERLAEEAEKTTYSLITSGSGIRKFNDNVNSMVTVKGDSPILGLELAGTAGDDNKDGFLELYDITEEVN